MSVSEDEGEREYIFAVCPLMMMKMMTLSSECIAACVSHPSIVSQSLHACTPSMSLVIVASGTHSSPATLLLDCHDAVSDMLLQLLSSILSFFIFNDVSAISQGCSKVVWLVLSWIGAFLLNQQTGQNRHLGTAFGYNSKQLLDVFGMFQLFGMKSSGLTCFELNRRLFTKSTEWAK